MKPFALVLIALGLCACSPKPVLFPNAYFKEKDKESVQRDIQDCYDMANEYVRSHKAADVAGSAAGGAATGAAVGAVSGAFNGTAGSSSATGAAVGAVVGLAKGAAHAKGPSPLFKNFVDTCLIQKGYQPMGWQ